MWNKIVVLIAVMLLCSSIAHGEEGNATGGSLPQVSIVSADDPGTDDAPTEPADPPARTEAPKPPKAGGDSGIKSFYGPRNPAKPAAPSATPKVGKTAPPMPGSKSSKEAFDEVPLPPTTPEDAYGDQRAIPEVTQKAPMSQSDVNRIVCPEPIKDVLYSTEKGVKVKYHDNNAFVKFTFDTVGDSVVYTKTPTELHVLCGDTTYTIVAVPMSIPPQTIRLGSGKEAKVRENASLFREDTTKQKIEAVLLKAFKDDLPDSFTVKNLNTPISAFRDLSVSLRRLITVDGEGIIVKEFAVVPQVDGLELKERQFLKKEITMNPAAIAIQPEKLRPLRGESVRVFVVEFKGGMGGNRLDSGRMEDGNAE